MTTAHSFSDLLVSEKPEVTTPIYEEPIAYFEKKDVSADKEAGIPSLTPIIDTIDGFRSIDWTHVRQQCRAGINNCGVVIAVISEKTHQFGVWLAEV